MTATELVNASEDDKQFTQKEINKFLAENRRKYQEQCTQLEVRLQTQNLTTEERNTLQTRYDDLRTPRRT